MMGPPVVPCELTDRIVDFLHNDQLALSALSLSGRSFLPTARYHRFSQVACTYRHERFVRLLDASPGIAPHVSTLVLDSGLSGNIWRELHETYACNLLDRLPFLQFLVLRNFRVRSLMMGLLGHNMHLRTLCVVRCDLPNLNALARLVWSLLDLKRLHIDNLSFSEDSPIPVSAPRPRLNAFGANGLSSELMGQFCSWIFDGEGDHGVQAFQTTIRSNAEAIATRSLVEKVGATLTEFEMDVDAEASLAAVFDGTGFSLNCLSKLCACKLAFKLREMCVPQNASLPWIAMLISQLSSPALVTVSISIYADNMQDLLALDSECGVRQSLPVQFDELQALDWSTLNATFTNRMLESLKNIVLFGQGSPANLLKWLQLSYPELTAMLQFVEARI